jgi:hypothetical protein
LNPPNQSIYNATKSAVDAITRELANPALTKILL